MSKKHFLIFDFLLPLVVILALGRLLAGRFAPVILARIDAIRPFGLGAWFLQSGLRHDLAAYAWLLFAIFPALIWLVWVRLNLETDPDEGRVLLDRPIFTCCRILVLRIRASREGDPFRPEPGSRREAAEARPEPADAARDPEARFAGASVSGSGHASDADFAAGRRKAARPPSSRS